MSSSEWQNKVDALTQQIDALRAQIVQLGSDVGTQLAEVAQQVPQTIPQILPELPQGGGFFWDALTVLILACFVGYYVIWNVTPALHAPLMGITNAISSVIIVGALIAAGPATDSFSKWLGFAGIILASINIFGGFVVTNRMLEMFTSRKKK